MIKLYGHPMSPSTSRPQVLLEELGLPYEYVTIDLMKGEQKAPDHVARNPMGRVPVLEDDDFVLWESNAILQYLADKRPECGLAGSCPKTRADVNRWLHWSSAHISAAEALAFYHTMGLAEDERVPAVAAEGKRDVDNALALLDRHLADRDYLAGDYSIADISVATIVATADHIGIDVSPFANVQRWLQRVTSRPAFAKALGSA